MIKIGTGKVNDLPQGSNRINKVYLGNNLVYQYVPPPPPNYFYSEAIEDGTFTLTIASSVTPTNLEYVSYSIDGGETWVKTDNVSGEVVTITTPTITAGNRVLWKGKAKTFASSFSAGTYSTFIGSAKHNIGGDIGYLFYSDDYSRTFESFQVSNALQHFFYNNVNLVNAENLILSTITCSRDRVYQSLFEGCSNLETPPTILATTATGYYCCYSMFSNCAKLKYAPDIHITTSHVNAVQYMFSGCSTITYANLSSIQTSGVSLYRTFYYCTSLSSVAVPPNITATGGNSFEGTALTSIDFLPSGVTEISSNSFYRCSGITSISSLPSGVTAIQNYAFSGTNSSTCCQLTTLDLSRYPITTLGSYAFRYCPVTNINLPSTLLTTGTYVFADTLITSITLPNSIKTIGAYTVANTAITDIYIPSSVEKLEAYVFSGCTGLQGKHIDLSHCTNLTTLGMGGCQAASISIPSSVTTIPGDGFRSCRFTEIDLSMCTNLTTIPLRCIYQDRSYLLSLKLPSSITTVEGSNFDLKTGAKFVVYATTPPTCASALYNPGDWDLYVPYSSDHSVLAAYQADQYWGAITRMYELNPDGTIPT